MTIPRSDELLFAAGGEVWQKYGTLYKRTLPEEESPVTFSRASDATFTDRSGNLRTAESGVVRSHFDAGESSYAVRLEASRTNELFNSVAPATQTRSLTAGTYTLWIEGSGSVDASGATDGAYGTATESTTVENDLTFTVSATQDVTFTVTGTVTRFQCEEGAFRSSFITTAGSAVTRSADSLSFDISGTPLATPQEMTIYCKALEGGTGAILHGSGALLQIGDTGTGKPRLLIDGSLGYRVVHQDGTSTVTSSSGVSLSLGDVVEVRAILHADGSVQLGVSVDGGAETLGTQSGSLALSPSWAGTILSLNQAGTGGTAVGFNDFLALTIAPGVKTMSEMRSLEI